MRLVPAATDVQRCDAIDDYTQHRRHGVDLWMKRDDLASPLYGGNKVRRYEFLFARARELGARHLYTLGGIASTQATATAVLGRANGFDVHLVLYDQPVTRFAREALCIDAMTGATLIRAGNFATGALRLWRELRRRARPERFLIEPGASSARANLGYVDAMLELAQQVEAGQCPRPDAIVVPAGSSGTLAAIALMCRYLRWDTEAIGVRIAPRIATNRVTIGYRVDATAKLLVTRGGADAHSLSGARWTVLQGFIGPGYGYPTSDAIDAIDVWKTLTGVPGEVTYSGKQLVALRSLIASGRLHRKRVLLWNTLSTPRPAVDAHARASIPAAFESVFEGDVVA